MSITVRQVPTRKCPFCSSDKTSITRDYLGYYVQCGHCKASGPREKIKREAIEAWGMES